MGISFSRWALGCGLAIATQVVTVTAVWANPQLDALLEQGNEAVQNQNFSQAVTAYSQATQLDGDNARIFSGLGFAHARLGNYAEAAIAYQRAVQLENNNPQFYFALGFSLANSGDNINASTAYARAVELEPANVEYNLGFATTLFRAEQYQAAYDAYQKVLTLDKENGLALKNSIASLLQLRRNRDAAALLQTAFVKLPTDSELRIHAAVTWFGLGDKPKAIAFLEEARRLSPGDFKVQLRLARIYENQQMLAEAIVAYQRAVAIQPESPEALRGLASAALDFNDFITAILAYRSLSEMTPNDPSVHENLGLALQGRNRRSEAIESLNTAKKLYQLQNNPQGVRKIDALLAAIADS